MKRYTQEIEKCSHCNRVFDDGEYYWKSSRIESYCYENKCGWEDKEE
jgi:hypothetical protein